MLRNFQACRLLFCASTLLLGACVGPLVEEIEIDDSTSARLRENVPTFTRADIESRPFSVVSRIESHSCFNNFMTDEAASPEAALDTLRLKASQLGADALLEPYCTSQGTSLATNCWQSFHCTGAAIAFGSASGRSSQSASAGSAFFASQKGFAITNFHVVEGCSNLTGSDGHSFDVVAVDRKNDVALVRQEGSPSAPYLPISGSSDVRPGQDVVVLGYPLTAVLSSDIKVSKGIVSSTAGVQTNQSIFQFTAQVQPGSSGGPVLDDSGAVIGVVVGKLDAQAMFAATGTLPEGVNFAIKSRIVKLLLNSAGVKARYIQGQNRRRTETIVDQSSGAVFPLQCHR